jgi:hypothetical protein
LGVYEDQAGSSLLNAAIACFQWEDPIWYHHENVHFTVIGPPGTVVVYYNRDDVPRRYNDSTPAQVQTFVTIQ